MELRTESSELRTHEHGTSDTNLSFTPISSTYIWIAQAGREQNGFKSIGFSPQAGQFRSLNTMCTAEYAVLGNLQGKSLHGHDQNKDMQTEEWIDGEKRE